MGSLRLWAVACTWDVALVPPRSSLLGSLLRFSLLYTMICFSVGRFVFCVTVVMRSAFLCFTVVMRFSCTPRAIANGRFQLGFAMDSDAFPSGFLQLHGFRLFLFANAPCRRQARPTDRDNDSMAQLIQ